MNKAASIVYMNDPNAATEVTVKAWKSLDGRIYLDEESARYGSATHYRCQSCKRPSQKPYTVCQECRDLAELERYRSKEKKHWDGKAMLYSEAKGEFFYNVDSVLDEADYRNIPLEELRMVICEPVYAWSPDPSDFYEDHLPDDGEVPDEVIAAFAVLEKTLSENKYILSWEPGPYALDLSSHADT